jgi:segregation and condensation protein B
MSWDDQGRPIPGLFDQDEPSLTRLVEALIFASDGPLSVERLKEVLEEAAETSAIRTACQALRLEYDRLNRAYELVEVAGGFQFRTRPEYGPLVAKLRKTAPLRLSRAALETLAIVAYKQPVLRAEVERIRGVDSGAVLKALLERGLVRVTGRESLPGRPLAYGTTRRFLEAFELKNLEALPRLEEMNLDEILEARSRDAELFPDEAEWLEPPAGETEAHGETPEDLG